MHADVRLLTLLLRAPKPLKSSPPGVLPPRTGVEVPPNALGTVIREMSRVRLTYSNAAISAPVAFSSFSSSAISFFEMALSGQER